MQVNNMCKTHQPAQDMSGQSLLSICALGFGAALEEKLEQLFKQQPLYRNSYHLVPATATKIDVLLVNYDNPLALRKKDLLVSNLCANADIVAVSRGALDTPPSYHIQGMLTASRLIAILNELNPKHTSSTPTHSASVLPHPAMAASQLAERTIVPSVVSNIETIESKLRYRALVVDDSLAIQKALELKLLTLEQIAGVDFAGDGKTALAMADAKHYDLIFLDIIMPGMDGYETCMELRMKLRYKKTPIIMISGKTSPLDEVKGVMAGCTTYLTKPVEEDAFQKLSSRVLAWLTSRHAQEAKMPDKSTMTKH